MASTTNSGPALSFVPAHKRQYSFGMPWGRRALDRISGALRRSLQRLGDRPLQGATAPHIASRHAWMTPWRAMAPRSGCASARETPTPLVILRLDHGSPPPPPLHNSLSQRLSGPVPPQHHVFLRALPEGKVTGALRTYARSDALANGFTGSYNAGIRLRYQRPHFLVQLRRQLVFESPRQYATALDRCTSRQSRVRRQVRYYHPTLQLLKTRQLCGFRDGIATAC